MLEGKIEKKRIRYCGNTARAVSGLAAEEIKVQQNTRNVI